MSQKITEELNKTKGNEVIVPCAKCSGRTAHEVVASIDQSGEDTDYDVQWMQHYQIIRCKGCKIISFRDANSNSDEYIQVGDDEWETRIYEKLYPSRIEDRKDLGNDARYLPPDTNRVYQETLQALNNNSPVLAGIGLRALVETVCMEKNASGKNLLEKIDDLAKQQILTPAGAAILHKIRTLGNTAAHEVKPHSETQLALGMNVIEHMLKDVYILHKRSGAGVRSFIVTFRPATQFIVCGTQSVIGRDCPAASHSLLFAQERVTREKGTPLPRPFGLPSICR